MYMHAAQKYKQIYIYIYKYIEVHTRNAETLTRVALLKTKKKQNELHSWSPLHNK